MRCVLSSASIKGTPHSSHRGDISHYVHWNTAWSLSISRSENCWSLFAGKARARPISADLGAQWCCDIWQGMPSTWHLYMSYMKSILNLLYSLFNSSIGTQRSKWIDQAKVLASSFCLLHHLCWCCKHDLQMTAHTSIPQRLLLCL
jgi:hypothetical protein